MFMFWPQNKKRSFDLNTPPLYLEPSDLEIPYEAKVEEAELEAKARKELDAAVERARAARRAVEEYIAAQKEK